MATLVTTSQELMDALAGLPGFSTDVYECIKRKLYAEPNFSDVTVADVAKALQVKPVAVNAAIKNLMDVGLVTTEDWESNGRTRCFLHTQEHDLSLQRIAPAVGGCKTNIVSGIGRKVAKVTTTAMQICLL